MADILIETPLSDWCLRTADVIGRSLAPNWAESGHRNRIYTELVLGESALEEPSPLQAHCVASAGSSPPATLALALGLDLVMSLPWPATSAQEAAGSLLSSGKFSMAGLIEPCEIIIKSAIMAAKSTAADLLQLHAHDGHLAVWLETTQALEEVIDLTSFPVVGNYIAPPQASVFATLPLEPGLAEDSPAFSISLRGMAVELMHELLRSAQRRDYIEFLHKLRDLP